MLIDETMHVLIVLTYIQPLCFSYVYFSSVIRKVPPKG